MKATRAYYIALPLESVLARNKIFTHAFTHAFTLASALLCGLTLSTATNAQTQGWPNRQIRFIVPFSPGGANDLMARTAALGASKILGQPIVIENKPGAGGTIGADAAAKSAADGYTFLISAAGVISNSMIKRNMPYQDGDLVPVAMIGLAPSVILVAPNSPYKTIKDLVEASRAAGGLHFATAGTGSTPHFVAELLNTRYGAKLDPVPYKSGSESTTALIGGQIAATSEASIVSLGYLKSGKLRGLATTWIKRIEAYPDLSTAAEQGFPEIRIAHWAGLHAPKGTPLEILDKMSTAIDAAMRSASVVDRLSPLGIQPVGGTRADFERFVTEERARLGATVRAAGMKED
jgi:tripartite-type tricarboxylate transporter receptor subunit TctC